jgi:hypothetical protein
MRAGRATELGPAEKKRWKRAGGKEKGPRRRGRGRAVRGLAESRPGLTGGRPGLDGVGRGLNEDRPGLKVLPGLGEVEPWSTAPPVPALAAGHLHRTASRTRRQASAPDTASRRRRAQRTHGCKGRLTARNHAATALVVVVQRCVPCGRGGAGPVVRRGRLAGVRRRGQRGLNPRGVRQGVV